ncbi:MAG: hypothetical protein VB115_10455 [Christensenellaceae bacterium]|nr:hypothetical protein [Christensenellaceae bacterium]
MKKHILLEKAFSYPEPQGSLAPEGCTFSEQSGYWVKATTGEPMMRSNDPKRPQTKKADRETGEDQKGE